MRARQSREFNISLERPAPGDHILSLATAWPDVLFEGHLRAVVSWHVCFVGDLTKLDPTKPGSWSSLGPRILVKAQPDGSQGRVDHIAVHPTDPNVLYAGAVRGGLCKSVNAGKSWFNLTDALSKTYGVGSLSSPLHAGAIALDPVEPDIVYFGTASSRYRGGVGIFKSLDGGLKWHQIATESDCRGVSGLSVCRPTQGKVIVYAATDKGLLRYVGPDARATNIGSTDWTQLRAGQVEEMAVDPTDAAVVYIAVLGTTQGMEGLYRSDNADLAAPSWKAVTAGLPPMGGIGSIRIDLFRPNPKNLYISIAQDPGSIPNAPRLSIFRSNKRGDSWSLQRSFATGEPTQQSLYNPFIRVHPTNVSLVWFGGVHLFKLNLSQPGKQPVKFYPPHDDHHAMVFDPNDPNRYYVTGDGGVWQCTVSGLLSDPCAHRNSDLRVMEFYDFDVAENNPNFILGGTQDNGTIVYQGHADWNETYQPRGGDGAYAVISPADQGVVLSQHQFLRDTWISTSGPAGPWIVDLLKGKGLPNEALYVRDAYVTFRPANPDVVATVGDQVYATANARSYNVVNGIRRSTAIWKACGPAGPTVRGTVTRILFQPGTSHWYAGTSEGQIWRSNHGIQGTWSLIDERSFDRAAVIGMAFAPTDSNVLYVLYNGGDNYRRVQRLQGLSGGLSGTWFSDNLPVNRQLNTISGDGYNADIAYVGTDKGVFQADLSRPTYDRWRTYNNQLPLVEINDLVVPTGRIHPASPSTVRAPERALFAASRGRGVWVTQTA